MHTTLLDFLTEAKEKKINQKDYAFYVFNIKINKINSGWEFKEDANEAIEELEGSDFKVYTKKYLLSKGINPDDNINWK